MAFNALKITPKLFLQLRIVEIVHLLKIVLIDWIQFFVKFIKLLIMLEKIVFSLFLMKKLISKVLFWLNWSIILEKAMSFQSVSAVLLIEVSILR
jgi:hypothetical protein